MKFYPIHPTDRHNLPGPISERKTIRAVFSGEFRPPKRGEWYLSGAIVEAYMAPNNLSTPFHIATLCREKTITLAIPVPLDVDLFPAISIAN